MRLRFFFFNDTATTEIYTLSLHDALPILVLLIIFMIVTPIIAKGFQATIPRSANPENRPEGPDEIRLGIDQRSEEHTSELQSPCNLVCRLLLEKKKTPHDSAVVTAAPETH